MTSCLFFDPAANYIKVNYFPEEPKYCTDFGDVIITCESTFCKCKSQLEFYRNSVADARASAVKVEDQEQAKYLMAKYIICNSNLECRLNQSGFSKWQPEPNVLYPIPGLTFKVEKVQDFKEFCSDEIIEVEEVAILELPSSNNTPDIVKEVDTLFKAMVYGVLYERSEIPMADIDYASYQESFSGMYERMLKDLKLTRKP